jgi:hypothetical protein
MPNAKGATLVNDVYLLGRPASTGGSAESAAITGGPDERSTGPESGHFERPDPTAWPAGPHAGPRSARAPRARPAGQWRQPILRDLVATDSTLGDLILRACLLRSPLLRGLGTGVQIIGPRVLPDTRRLQTRSVRTRRPVICSSGLVVMPLRRRRCRRPKRYASVGQRRRGRRLARWLRPGHVSAGRCWWARGGHGRTASTRTLASPASTALCR